MERAKRARFNGDNSMLDKKTDAVLELLFDNTQNSYKVLNKAQIIAELPQKMKIDAAAFSAILTFLTENEYVGVKYQDKDEISLSPSR